MGMNTIFKTKPELGKDCNHEWEQVLEGTTIKGSHIHIYRCTAKKGCGLLLITHRN